MGWGEGGSGMKGECVGAGMRVGWGRGYEGRV